MDRRKQRSQKRTAVTKEQALNFLCATMRLSKIVKPINAVRGTATGSRSPAGPRRLGTATRISASLSRRLSAFFESTSRPRSQSGKVRRSDTRPGDVRERAVRVEGSDSGPIRNSPCFGVRAVVCDPLSKGECVPAFTRESERGPFVREAEKCDEKRFGTAL